MRLRVSFLSSKIGHFRSSRSQPRQRLYVGRARSTALTITTAPMPCLYTTAGSYRTRSHAAHSSTLGQRHHGLQANTTYHLCGHDGTEPWVRQTGILIHILRTTVCILISSYSYWYVYQTALVAISNLLTLMATRQTHPHMDFIDTP